MDECREHAGRDTPQDAPGWMSLGWLAAGDAPRSRREAAVQTIVLGVIVLVLVAITVNAAFSK
jgi:hypothetical protein